MRMSDWSSYVCSSDLVPELLVTGLQAVEDRDFKFHRGVDPLGILRAAWVDLRSGQLRQGGSTLTQQLVRSQFLSNAQTFSQIGRASCREKVCQYVSM